ncbi:MAG: aldo/keto reductase [Candidatus Latescibacterota bacterium]|nr:aldo/keto reductase [Candidatus Latescibacterota bacterium]
MKRRKFIRLSAQAGFAIAANKFAGAVGGSMPLRLLGKTGEHVSALCLGGYHIGQRKLEETKAIQIMHAAIDGGINFFDNAWQYNDGRSEELMGKALSGARRHKVLLMTKHLGRDPVTALQQLETSLSRLQTDCVDLWQFHAIGTPGDVNAVYNSGVLEIALRAREQGKIRYIGFTGHLRPGRHVEMLAGDFEWDTVQMPISPFDYHYESFQKKVLPLLNSKNIGSIAMKTLGGNGGVFLREDKFRADELLGYAQSMPVSSVCVGMDDMGVLKTNIETAYNFIPFPEDKMLQLRNRCLPMAQGGQEEHYKKG